MELDSKTDTLELKPQFYPKHETVSFLREKTALYLDTVEKHFKEGIANNSECLQKFFMSKNCSYQCTILSVVDLPLCQTIEQMNCMTENIYYTTEYYDCFRTKSATTFKVRRIDTPFHFTKNDKMTRFNIGIWTNVKEIQEEVFLITTESFIGTVGGSLGMFFGFSFSASIFFCLKKVFNKVF